MGNLIPRGQRPGPGGRGARDEGRGKARDRGEVADCDVKEAWAGLRLRWKAWHFARFRLIPPDFA